jgi:putative membrane protein
MDNQTKNNFNKDLILRERLALQRTSMSNDSTLLSFIRTSLYFSIAGMSVNTLLRVNAGVWIEIVFWALAILILTIGIWKYFKQKQRLKDSERHIGDYKLNWEELDDDE